MATKYPLILISGATATGKTSTAITLAKKCYERLGQEAEVINGDSLLFYKELFIGTARPTIEEMSGIPHHLVGHQSIDDPLNASEYCEQALPIIKELHRNQKVPIVVGGSAFYIRALIKGMYESGETDPQAKEILDDLEEKQGWQGIRNFLKEKDPESFNTIHENDHYRTLRALEYFLTHKKPISDQRKKIDEEGPYDFSQLRDPSWSLHHIYLEIPKEEHWLLMEKRAKLMLDTGLVDEVKGILQQGFSPELKPLQSIGYKETLDFLNSNDNDLSSRLEDLIERIYINTRKLSKSQKTFFKKITPKKTYNPLKDLDQIEADFFSFLKRS